MPRRLFTQQIDHAASSFMLKLCTPCIEVSVVLTAFFALLCLYISPIQAQESNRTEPAITVATKDPAALALLQRAFQLSGGSSWASVSDFTLVGVEHDLGNGDKDSAVSLSGTSKGKYRLDESNKGLPVRSVTFDGVHGRYTRGSDAAKDLPPHAIFNMPPLFPLPSLAAAIKKERIAVVDRGSTQWDGKEVRVVESRIIFSSPASHESPMNRLTAKRYYLDPVSGQLLGISWHSYSLANSNVFVESSFHYSDFRSENGITYPHVVTEDLNKQKIRTIKFSSLAINAGVDDSRFH